MAASLGRLVANIGGPSECRRSVYAIMVQSVVLYGAPIWAQAVAADRITTRDAARLQRQLALRVIRGYRIISYEASLLLVRLIPFDGSYSSGGSYLKAIIFKAAVPRGARWLRRSQGYEPDSGRGD